MMTNYINSSYKERKNMRDWFNRFASTFTKAAGSPMATVIAFASVVSWFIGGLYFGYGTDYQMYINTGTTIVTFLMVFLIQNTQNRDAKAMHLKLDELISSVKAAHNEMISIEELTDKQLEEIAAHYRKKKEEFSDDTIAAIATDAAHHAANDTAHRVAGNTAQRVAGDTAKKVADDTAKRVVKDKKQRVA
jgi:low affinity Fe/Cu permease